MITIIATIGVITNLVIVLVTVQSRKTRVRNVSMSCATHEFKIKTM